MCGTSTKRRNFYKQDENGNFALLIAIRKENAEMVELLINNGADVDIYDEQDLTALMIAVLNECCKIVHLLLNYGSSVNTQDKDEYTALLIAI